jgi:hypothetical protein
LKLTVALVPVNLYPETEIAGPTSLDAINFITLGLPSSSDYGDVIVESFVLKDGKLYEQSGLSVRFVHEGGLYGNDYGVTETNVLKAFECDGGCSSSFCVDEDGYLVSTTPLSTSTVFESLRELHVMVNMSRIESNFMPVPMVSRTCLEEEDIRSTRIMHLINTSACRFTWVSREPQVCPLEDVFDETLMNVREMSVLRARARNVLTQYRTQLQWSTLLKVFGIMGLFLPWSLKSGMDKFRRPRPQSCLL